MQEQQTGSMPASCYSPILELSRGKIVESIHYGAIAVVDIHGQLIAYYGDPHTATFWRSTAKPFQALPFIEAGGHQTHPLTAAEIALMCASHSGTDEHVAAIETLQAKLGLSEDQLMCGTHPPMHKKTAETMLLRGESPRPYRHNCSGKHTSMLAYAKMNGWLMEGYIDPDHPVQQAILKTFAEMCNLLPEQIALGIDGCSVPTFATSLYHAALAFARLADPSELSERRASACRTITAAMMAHPEMVGGPERFDTELMEATQGRIVTKAGAEGYQGIGLLPGASGSNSPALGIAVKISDGDGQGRVRPAVVLEVLRQLGALSAEELEALSKFGPTSPIHNWRKVEVGERRPSFILEKN